jgi:hypothetical protein
VLFWQVADRLGGVPPARWLATVGVVVLVLLAGCAGVAPSDRQAAQPTTTVPASTIAPSSPATGALVARDPVASPGPVPRLAFPAPRPLVPDGGATTLPAPAASPTPTAPPATAPAPRPRPFAIDLYGRGDFVSQHRSDWCVPAAIQIMANLVVRRGQASVPSQRALNRRARELSSSRLIGLGSEPQGWAGVLNELGDGPYRVVAKRTFRAAVTAAARALRLTHRPVGLLIWRGAHAWVMSGFEATADPAKANAFTVTALRVSDPWYPRATGSWGRTRPPDARIGMAALARVYVPWHRPFSRYAELDGRYVLVLPVVEGGAG